MGQIQKMSTVDKDNDVVVPVCANCGKEGAKNICNKCQSVKYCNAVCKKVHKKKHKKHCEEHVRLVAEKHNEELRRAAEKHDIELFKQPPPEYGDCPICLLLLPTIDTGRRYMSCCGKEICSGCCYAPVYDNQGNEVDNKKCPYCRTPWPSSYEEALEGEKKRMKLGDRIAICNHGNNYRDGTYGFPQDYVKALEFYHRAAELGFAGSYCNIGNAYFNGEGVEVDKEKATYYYELAAMGGNVVARHNLGFMEEKAGNMDRAVRHLMIATRGGYSYSLNNIKVLYSEGEVSKECYMKALQSYQTYLSEIKSVQRDKDAAAREDYRYY